MLRLAAPQALWLLAAVPVLILLHMLRARRQPQVVSSILLWRSTARDLQTRLPIRRLERSLLLLLQIAAVTLLGLGLARPALVLPGVAGPATVLVFDVSLSMQARDVPPTRFAEARRQALELVGRLRPGQHVMIVEAGRTPRVVMDLTGDRRRLIRAILSLHPTDGAADVDAAVGLALAQHSDGRPAQVIVYGDRAGPGLDRVAYRVLARDAADIAITRAVARAPGDGAPMILVEITNHSTVRRTVPLRIDWPDGSRQALSITLGAGERVTRVWPGRGDGIARITAQTGDSLPADDVAQVLVGEPLLPRILLVGEGNPFLEAVLSVLPVREVRQTAAVDPQTWAGFDLVVLNRTPPVALPPGHYLLLDTVAPNLPLEVQGTARNIVARWADATHPLLRMVDLRGTQVAAALRLRPHGGDVLVEGEAPLLWALDRGDLKVAVLPFDLDASDLGLHPAFPLLMANALEWLASPLDVTAGDRVAIPAGLESAATLVTPDGASVAVAARGGLYALPRLDRAGIYVLRTEAWERPILVRTAAAEEADVRRAPPASRGAAPGADRTGREVPLWSWLLAAALACVAAEAVLWLRTLPGTRRGRRGGARAPGAPRPLLALRLGVVASLILGLLGLEIARAGRDLSVVFALDLSDSMRPADTARALEIARAATARARPGDRFGLVAFGASALVAQGVSDSPHLDVTDRPSGYATDIGGAVRSALGLLPASGGRRIVLLTDGGDTEGGASAAVALAAADAVEVGVVPVGGARGPDAAVAEVRAPETVRPGERFEVEVWVESTDAAAGTLQLLSGDRVVMSTPVRLGPGRAVLRVPQQATTQGVVRYEARLQVEPDRLVENNRGQAIVRVQGPPTVLYVAGDPADRTAVRRWLQAQGLMVRTVTPGGIPTAADGLLGTGAVVLDDVPAMALSPAQRGALRDFVGALGGGLVVIGGPQAYGPGGYAGTELETVLPVTMDVRHRVAMPSMAVLLVLDASGSMGSFGRELPKVELAKEAAQSVVDLLGERDTIGVIAFDQDPHWLVPLTEARHREQILQQVSRITAGGGTNLYPALRQAFDALQRTRAKVKHVIILSDGQTDPGDFERLARRMSAAKITVSSVAIGNDADRDIMRNLAAWGRGRYYFTRDLYTVPQIFTAEALLASRAYLVEERFRPVPAQGSPLLAGVGGPPELRGYVATSPKAAAAVHLSSPQRDPILATWQYGLGRAAAFSSDAGRRWAVDWLAWPESARLWSRLVRWAMQPAVDLFDVRASSRGRTIDVVLDARGRDGAFLTDLAAQARLIGAAADRAGGDAASGVLLMQTAPGRYEGSIPVPGGPGAYLVGVEARRSGRLVGAGRTTVTVPVSPELRATSTGSALPRLVELPGVRVMTTPAEILAPPSHGRRTQPAWPPLTALALGLFVTEITLRRLPVLSEWTGRGLAAVAGFLRPRAPSPPSPDDREYDAADRWRILQSEEEALRAASMEQAARLYIARLRQQQEAGRQRTAETEREDK